jgi:hypothetical protein
MDKMDKGNWMECEKDKEIMYEGMKDMENI